MIDGYNQRDASTPDGQKWCCACYVGALAKDGASDDDVAAVERSKVCGWHTCQGCRCFIHTSIFCSEVCNGEGDGDYLCGHCFAATGTPAPLPAGDEDVQTDDDDASEDVLAKSKRHKSGMGAQQPRQTGETPHARKHQRCKHCGQPGHNKRRCPQLRQ